MFEREARWISDRLAACPLQQISPLLNIGSGTRAFREVAQPWIERDLFAPLAARGVEIVHLDARAGDGPGDGIDIRADLLHDDDFARLAEGRRYAALLCCNVLEHVRDPGAFAHRCAMLVRPGGLIVVTVPRSYPHHADPIDTLYRPTPDEAAALFPRSALVTAEIIDVGLSYRDEIRRRPWLLLRPLLRLPVPFLGLAKWRNSMVKPYWLFHNYRVSAAVLRREDEPSGPAEA
ncbi:MAG: class I SAM-dependent methyltransferase [Alphaproteobacteria bacterium]